MINLIQLFIHTFTKSYKFKFNSIYKARTQTRGPNPNQPRFQGQGQNQNQNRDQNRDQKKEIRAPQPTVPIKRGIFFFSLEFGLNLIIITIILKF